MYRHKKPAVVCSEYHPVAAVKVSTFAPLIERDAVEVPATAELTAQGEERADRIAELRSARPEHYERPLLRFIQKRSVSYVTRPNAVVGAEQGLRLGDKMCQVGAELSKGYVPHSVGYTRPLMDKNHIRHSILNIERTVDAVPIVRGDVSVAYLFKRSQRA